MNLDILSEVMKDEADNTYLSYNKVIGTSLNKELYLAFQILDYALLSAPGNPEEGACRGRDWEGYYGLLR